MLHPVLDRQFAHPRTIPLFRYNPDRAPFSLREWNPAAVGCAEDLPPYLILGKLDASSFEKSAGGWSARWQGTEEDTHFDVAYSAAECRWRISQKWQGVGGGYSFYDAQIPLGTVIAQTLYTKFPSNWERAAKQGLESEYQVNVMEQTEKSISLCTIPDGAPQGVQKRLDEDNRRFALWQKISLAKVKKQEDERRMASGKVPRDIAERCDRQRRHVEKLGQQRKEWLEHTLEVVDTPFLRLAAVFVGE